MHSKQNMTSLFADVIQLHNVRTYKEIINNKTVSYLVLELKQNLILYYYKFCVEIKTIFSIGLSYRFKNMVL